MTNWFADHIVKELYTGVLDTVADEKGFSATWGLFYDFLRPHEQTAILHSILRNIEKTYFSMEKGQRHVNKDVIGAVATLFSQITKDRSLSGLQVRVCLTTGHGGIIHSLGLRRALMLQYSSDEGRYLDIRFQNCRLTFSKRGFERHTYTVSA
jgi:telomere length regulation protein